MKKNEFVFFVTCALGFEKTLQEELEEIYSEFSVDADINLGSAGCYVSGPFSCCILANLKSMCASRVLLVLLEKNVRSEQDIYQNIVKLNWTSFFSVKNSFVVKSTVSNSFLQNSLYLSLKVKDAICDSFINVMKERPNVDTENAEVKIFVRLAQNNLSVSLDTSGESLFMRGYRKEAGDAPLKETLAASLLRMTGWQRLAKSLLMNSNPVFFDRTQSTPPGKIPKQVLLSPFFLDPFCGSGTFVVEAALALLQSFPNVNRERFGFFNLYPEKKDWIISEFKIYQQKVLQQTKSVSEVKEAIFAYAKSNHINFESTAPLHGCDIDVKTLEKANKAVEKAHVDELVTLSCLDVNASKPHASCGLIATNPPYGLRIGELEKLTHVYKNVGDVWKKNFPNWSAWLLSANESLTKSIGLRPTRKISVYNGNIECRFLQYVLYPF